MQQAQTNITLQDIIDNMRNEIETGRGASRVAMNHIDLLSLLLAIQNELDEKLDREPGVS